MPADLVIPISEIISVSVSSSPPAVTGQSFNIPLIMGFESGLPTTPTSIRDTDDLDDLGLVDTDPTYIRVAAIKAQESMGGKAVDSILVVKRLANQAQISTIAYDVAVNGATYTAAITVDGTTYTQTITADGTATMQEIVEALAAALNGALPASTVAVTEDNVTLTLTAEVAGLGFSFTGSSNSGSVAVTLATTTANRNGATQLATALASDSSWYWCLPVGSGQLALTDLDVEQIGAWALTTKKAAYLLSDTANTVSSSSTDDPAYTLTGTTNTRAAVAYHDVADEDPVGANFGRCGGYDPTVLLIPWNRQQVAGITSVQLDTQAGAKAKRVNIYARFFAGEGGAIMWPGLMSSTYEIRQRVGIDACVNRIQTNLFNLGTRLAAQGYPTLFTETGLEAIGTEIQEAVNLFAEPDTQLFTERPVVVMPLLSTISSADRTAGLLTGIKITGNPADQVLITEIALALVRS